MDALKGTFFMLLLTVALYLSHFQEVEGLINIGLAYLWFMGVMIIWASFSKSQNKESKTQSMTIKYFFRAWAIAIPLALIYAGSFILGFIYLIGFMTMWSKNSTPKKEIEVER